MNGNVLGAATQRGPSGGSTTPVAKPMVASASGSWVYDENGRDYLDASSGTVCVNIGHGVPEVLDAMADQAKRVCFAHRSQFRNRPAEELSAEIHQVSDGRFREIVYTNSGSEATEAALRLAMHHHAVAGRSDRVAVLTQYPSYHGMTAGALGVSGHPIRRRNLTALHDTPVSVGAVRARGAGRFIPDLRDWSAAFDRVGPDRIAAVLVEVVGGAASGAMVIGDDTLRGLRELCDNHGALLVVDEVMTGFGRTGDWFAHTGVVADLVTAGKGISAGYAPLGACLVGHAVLPGHSAADLAVGHTMNGNPLSSATALAVLRYLRTHQLVERAGHTGEHMMAHLRSLAAEFPFAGEPRGKGMLVGIPLRQSPAGFAVEPLARRVCETALQCGLIVYPAGVDHASQAVLVAPPLTLRADELDVLVERLGSALRQVAAAGGTEPVR